MNGSNLDDVTQGHEGRLVPDEERTPAEYPKRIGRYRVEEVLGKGGFGLVDLAHLALSDENLGKGPRTVQSAWVSVEE